MWKWRGARGSVSFSRYRRVEQISADDIGSLWVARDRSSQSLVTLRVVDPGSLQRDGLGEAVHQGLKATFPRLRHANVATVLTYGGFQETGKPFLVMEHMRGTTLADRLGREPPPTLEESQLIIGGLAAALGAAHSVGIAHGALRPESVLLVEGGRVKLMDFGLRPLWGHQANGDPVSADRQALVALEERMTGATAERGIAPLLLAAGPAKGTRPAQTVASPSVRPEPGAPLEQRVRERRVRRVAPAEHRRRLDVPLEAAGGVKDREVGSAPAPRALQRPRSLPKEPPEASPRPAPMKRPIPPPKEAEPSQADVPAPPPLPAVVDVTKTSPLPVEVPAAASPAAPTRLDRKAERRRDRERPRPRPKAARPTAPKRASGRTAPAKPTTPQPPPPARPRGEPGPRKPRLRTAALVALVLAIGAGATYGVLGHRLGERGGSDQVHSALPGHRKGGSASVPARGAKGGVAVPRVRGLTSAGAQVRLLAVGLPVVAVTPAPGQPGKVIGIEPAEGTRVFRGTAVRLVIGVPPGRMSPTPPG